MFIPEGIIAVHDAALALYWQHREYHGSSWAEYENCVKSIRSKLSIGTIKAIGISPHTSASIDIPQSYWRSIEADIVFAERKLIQFIDSSGKRTPFVAAVVELNQLRNIFGQANFETDCILPLELKKWSSNLTSMKQNAKTNVTISELKEWYTSEHIPKYRKLKKKSDFPNDLIEAQKKFPNRKIPERRFREEVRAIYSPEHWRKNSGPRLIDKDN